MKPTLTYEDFKQELYRERGQQVSRGMTEKAGAGLVTGPLPLGYRSERTAEGVRAAIDEQSGPLVRQAFLMAAEGKSFRTILVGLAGLGLTSKRGRPLSLSSLHNMLTNPFYSGETYCQGKLIEGTHEAIVSKALFAEVQTKLGSTADRAKH